MKKIVVFIICVFSFSCVCAQWEQDILGDGYQKRVIRHLDDYSGKVRSTLIKKTSNDTASRKIGVLYIHGYNDYFFQKDLGDNFVAIGIDFYATDLRKYGRSIEDTATMFEVRNLREYYADIDSAIDIMKQEGVGRIFLMGHSTGGLISALYVQETGNELIDGLILNSPFFDWNMSGFMKSVMLPILYQLSHIDPNISFSQGASTAYGESLLKKHHGEWEYNQNWKMMPSPKVRVSWLKAINDAQVALKNGNKITIPILLMHSDKSINGYTWTEEFNNGDAVLNVKDISKIGRKLGFTIREVTVYNGIHDLILSRKEVRDAVYRSINKWIFEITLLHQ